VREAAVEIEATALVPAAPEDVFEFLSDLANHWRLVDRLVEVLTVEGDPPNRAVVRLRGPLGVRRTVRTRVTAMRAPRLLIGVAEMGAEGETRALVSWTLGGRLGQTRVRLAAEVEQATALDRALLALGGRAWLRRRFAFGLERLAERFAQAAAATAAVAPDGAVSPSPKPAPPLPPAERSSRPTPS
jgi:uncharacterized protein YndB with AHSA1/START domain